MKKVFLCIMIALTGCVMTSCDNDDDFLKESDFETNDIRSWDKWGPTLDESGNVMHFKSIKGTIAEDKALSDQQGKYYIKVDKSKYFPNVPSEAPYLTDEEFRMYPLTIKLTKEDVGKKVKLSGYAGINRGFLNKGPKVCYFVTEEYYDPDQEVILFNTGK